ncbi:MAG: hypothetical protein QM811_21700 [Pirellulales bacterium]
MSFVRTHLMACLALLVTCGVLLAADAGGKWTWTVQQGKKDAKKDVEYTADLKVEGDKVTGTVSSSAKKGTPVAIEDGKIEGDKVSFKVSRANKEGTKIVSEYSGKVEGDTLKGTFVNDASKGKQTDWSATRAK